ncbi:uncharacterized [Tachysurus ichikawai]
MKTSSFLCTESCSISRSFSGSSQREVGRFQLDSSSELLAKCPGLHRTLSCLLEPLYVGDNVKKNFLKRLEFRFIASGFLSARLINPSTFAFSTGFFQRNKDAINSQYDSRVTEFNLGKVALKTETL